MVYSQTNRFQRTSRLPVGYDQEGRRERKGRAAAAAAVSVGGCSAVAADLWLRFIDFSRFQRPGVPLTSGTRKQATEAFRAKPERWWRRWSYNTGVLQLHAAHICSSRPPACPLGLCLKCCTPSNITILASLQFCWISARLVRKSIVLVGLEPEYRSSVESRIL